MSKNQLTLVGFATTGTEFAGNDSTIASSVKTKTGAKAKRAVVTRSFTQEVVLFDRALVTAKADELFHLDNTTREIGRTGVAAARAALLASDHAEAA